MPAARQASRSPCIAFAVSATIGRRARPVSRSRARQVVVADRPSITGIWQSISTTSKRVADICSSASAPLPATLAVTPRVASSSVARSWLIRLSSTSSTRRPSRPELVAGDVPAGVASSRGATPASSSRSVRRSCDWRTGLESRTSGASRSRSGISASSSSELSSTAGAARVRGSARNARSRSTPSESGSWPSRISTSGGATPPASFAPSGGAATSASAVCASGAALTAKPAAASCRCRISRLTGWSSTISTRRPANGIGVRRLPVRSRASPSRSGRRAVKQLPRPGSLCSVIVPPISSTSWREIARPRPVPP